MALELFINEKQMDLLPGTVIAMSYANNFIAEAIAPAGSASNQFNLPKTQPNIDALEAAHSINSDTNIPYQKLSVRLIQNGRELISDGFAVVEESSRFYKIILYGGNLDFFEIIKGRKLRDLTSLAQYDHIWNFLNVATSRGNASGYIYPIIDWNDDDTFMDNITNKADPRVMYHAIFVHTIMDAIFTEAGGFNKSGDILNDSRYLQMIVPIVDSIQSDTLKDDRKVIAQFNPSTAIFPHNIGNIGFNGITITPVILTNNTLGDIYNFWTAMAVVADGVSYSTWGYTAPVTGNYNVQFTGHHRQTENIFYACSLQLWKVKPSEAKTVISESPITISQVPFDINTSFRMDQGDKMIIQLVAGGTFPASQFPLAFIGSPLIDIRPVTNRNVYNTKISAVDNLPNMTQTDFIKSIAKIFGIIFQTNSFTKTVEFKQFKNIYDNIPNAKNWTDKLDMNTTNKQPVLNYHPKGYAQSNVFKWTNEVSGTLDEKLGQGEILINDESLDNETDLIVVLFSATEMSKKLIDLDVPVIRFLKLGVPKGSIKPRILILDKTSSVIVQYNDTVDSGNVGNNVPLCYFQLTGKSFNLGFDDSLISDSYNEFEFFLNKFKRLTAYYSIDENDIAELDFFTPIFDDHFKHYFFIDEINNFITGRSTKIKLVRL